LSAFREAVFRYSKFKTDLERIRNGARPVYAGAFWRDIEAIQDSRPGAGDRAVRQAAQISKATFGDYGDLTVGGQWLGPTQDRMYELVEELGLRTYPTYDAGKLLLQPNGKQQRMGSQKGAVPRLNPFALVDLARGFATYDRLAKTVPLDRPAATWRPCSRSVTARSRTGSRAARYG